MEEARGRFNSPIRKSRVQSGNCHCPNFQVLDLLRCIRHNLNFLINTIFAGSLATRRWYYLSASSKHVTRASVIYSSGAAGNNGIQTLQEVRRTWSTRTPDTWCMTHERRGIKDTRFVAEALACSMLASRQPVVGHVTN